MDEIPQVIAPEGGRGAQCRDPGAPRIDPANGEHEVWKARQRDLIALYSRHIVAIGAPVTIAQAVLHIATTTSPIAIERISPRAMRLGYPVAMLESSLF